MSRLRKSASMRVKIALLCVLSTLSALLLQSLLFQRSSSALIYEQSRQANENALGNMQNEVYTLIRAVENNLTGVYNETGFIRDLSRDMPASELRARYGRLAHDMALNISEPSQYLCALYYYTMSDDLINSYRRTVTPRYNYPADIYLDPEATNAERVLSYVRSDDMTLLVSGYYNVSRKSNVIRFVLKIYANNATRKIGYVVCDIDERWLSRILEKYVLSADQYIWLQPLGDQPVVCVGNMAESPAGFERIATRLVNHTGPEYEALEETDTILFEVAQKKYNLPALSLVAQSFLQRSQVTLTTSLILTSAFDLVLFSLLSILLSRGLTAQMVDMARTVRKIEEGDTSLRIVPRRSDEMGQLAVAINDMLERIEELLTAEYQAKLLAQSAEYKALQAQINPHFLFNTLDNMQSIATSQGCHSVGTLCRALSSIFRYCLDMEGPLSSLRQELIHLQNYMTVMNVRMQNSILLDIEVDDTLLEVKTPRLSLQPLVENAITHGLRNKRGEKRIWIVVQTVQSDIVVTVKDNGVGMDSGTLKALLAQNDIKNVLGKNDSIGLRNINARLKLIFGPASGLDVDSVPGQGCTVSFRFPREMASESIGEDT